MQVDRTSEAALEEATMRRVTLRLVPFLMLSADLRRRPQGPVDDAPVPRHNGCGGGRLSRAEPSRAEPIQTDRQEPLS